MMQIRRRKRSHVWCSHLSHDADKAAQAEHIAALKQHGLDPDAFEHFVGLFVATMAEHNLPEERVSCIAAGLRGLW